MFTKTQKNASNFPSIYNIDRSTLFTYKINIEYTKKSKVYRQNINYFTIRLLKNDNSSRTVNNVGRVMIKKKQNYNDQYTFQPILGGSNPCLANADIAIGAQHKRDKYSLATRFP